ncbi:MAG: DUF4080 domain-containing protein [Lachnospiraceae bacterium]|nr:DUF4080 domain-containing protein [Lachnospiraceae bacterium]
MKILLVAVNAKYVHSNLAVYCLKSYAAAKGYETEIAEYTINQQPGDVLRDLYEKQADVVAFSCYIWNIEFVKALICDYKKISPQTQVWLGGPEVSYRAEEILGELPNVRGVMCGEGEETFARLTKYYSEKEMGREEEQLQDIPGIVFRTDDNEIQKTAPVMPLDFSRLPFPYGKGEVTVSERTELSDFANRIVYYESSRGCPYSCAYCLSSIDKRVRFRDMELVKQELAFFVEQKVPQVKFIDRTFNANAKRTLELWNFIKEKDNGVTNFHFEIAAELLTEEQIALLHRLRPGLVQLEIGVQSANEETLSAVHRKTDFEKLKETVAKIRSYGNVHIHLDLIAGLPKEDKASFQNSYNEVYRMRPHQLQLGFLKVLSGSPMENMAKENGILYQGLPPYEVLQTKWLSYEDITELKKVEEMTEVYYNSGQFVYSMLYLEHFFETPYELYQKLAEYYEKENLFGVKLSRGKRYEVLLAFVKEEKERRLTGEGRKKWDGLQDTVFEQILFFDYCLREKVKGRPEFGRHSHMEKQELKQAYERFGVNRDEEGMHGLEKFSLDPVCTAEKGKTTGKAQMVLFSYEEREPIYGQATIRKETV